MKKMRKAHLWIGLITSAFLLMEAITGLLLTEPWLIGQETKHAPMLMEKTEGTVNNAGQGQSTETNIEQGGNKGTADIQQGGFEKREGFNREGGNSLMSIVRGLHEGRLGTMNIKWVVDIAAISMIFLTGSGIYLSVKILRAQRKARKKQSLRATEAK